MLRPICTIVALAIQLFVIAPLSFAQLLPGGDFSDPTGAPWQFVASSADAYVDYSGESAFVIGSNDGITIDSYDYIAQQFSLAAGNQEIIFGWWYYSYDAPGSDGAFWDLVEIDTAVSVIGGPVMLATYSPSSGVVQQTVPGGAFELRLGMWSSDSSGGAGGVNFDNVSATGLISIGTMFVRGDVNGDGAVDVSDAIALLADLFIPGSPRLSCDDAIDANDDGQKDVSDAVFLLAALFVPGSAPIPAPAPDCGLDATTDVLICDRFSSCP